MSGLYIEIVTEAANRLGMKPVFETDEWMGCRQKLENSEADVLLGLEIFSNMEGTLRTIPVCSDELRVYGKNQIDSAAAVAGKKVALMARSVIEATYDLQCEYEEYYTNTEILEAVEKGEADYGICHSAVATKIIEKNGFTLEPSLVIAKSYPALAVKDTRPELRDDLNRVLQEMSIDGTIGRLQNKWITEFTKDRSFKHVVEENELFYVTVILGIILLICVTLGYRMNYINQEEYINTLLDYQEKLKRSNEETQQANNAKSEFLSHMSHDIRTPLNGIMGMVEIIKQSRNDGKKVEECLEKIDVASSHLLSLINDVLDMSKLGSKELYCEEEPVNLKEETEKIYSIMELQTKSRNIDFNVHLNNIEHNSLLGGPAHLRRILLNLLSNAMKYNKDGGKIDLSLREIKCENDYAFIEFKVEDTGIGMSRDFIENSLYKPFTQENNSARTEYMGTGLGMSIVREMVERMNGTINAESKLGEGTVFTVVIPFKINKEVAKRDTEKHECNISGMKILVAEDNEINREIVEFMLENSGAEVKSVSDGKQAVEEFENSKENEYDAILMDIMMPVMDGIEAVSKIRKLNRKDAKTVIVIAMTANAFEEDKKKTKDAGMNEHLTKPIDRVLLTEVLSKYKK